MVSVVLPSSMGGQGDQEPAAGAPGSPSSSWASSRQLGACPSLIPSLPQNSSRADRGLFLTLSPS